MVMRGIDKMKCPTCGKEMSFEDAVHRWNIRTHYCENCGYETDEDITGELIDRAERDR